MKGRGALACIGRHAGSQRDPGADAPRGAGPAGGCRVLLGELTVMCGPGGLPGLRCDSTPHHAGRRRRCPAGREAVVLLPYGMAAAELSVPHAHSGARSIRTVRTVPKRTIKCREAHRPEHETSPARRCSARPRPVLPSGAGAMGARTGGEGHAHALIVREVPSQATPERGLPRTSQHSGPDRASPPLPVLPEGEPPGFDGDLRLWF